MRFFQRVHFTELWNAPFSINYLDVMELVMLQSIIVTGRYFFDNFSCFRTVQLEWCSTDRILLLEVDYLSPV
jgi:hypothetical protein